MDIIISFMIGFLVGSILGFFISLFMIIGEDYEEKENEYMVNNKKHK